MKTFQIEAMIAQITKFTEMFRTGSFVFITCLLLWTIKEWQISLWEYVFFSLAAVARPTFFSVCHLNWYELHVFWYIEISRQERKKSKSHVQDCKSYLVYQCLLQHCNFFLCLGKLLPVEGIVSNECRKFSSNVTDSWQK